MQALRVFMERLSVLPGVCDRDTGEVGGLAAAWSWRNERAVRASARVAQECAYLVGGFGRKNVLELARLLLDFGLAVHGEAVGKEAFSQAVAADNIGGALTARLGEFGDYVAVPGGVL